MAWLRVLLCVVLVGGVGIAAEAGAVPILIDFEEDAEGGYADGFASVDSPIVHFSDTVDEQLAIFDFDFSTGKALLVYQDDDGSGLQIDFDVPAVSLQLDFGNDDPLFTNPGDLAVLTVFDGAAQVGQTTVVLNRNDEIDQSIAISGVGPFDRAVFAFTDAALSPYTGGGSASVGLTEIVDNVLVEVPEPGVGLLGAAAGAALAARRRRARDGGDC